jgi:hypothetical protein
MTGILPVGFFLRHTSSFGLLEPKGGVIDIVMRKLKDRNSGDRRDGRC